MSQIITLDNSLRQIIDNNNYAYDISKIMNYKESHTVLNYDKDDFFPICIQETKAQYYWQELFNHPQINLDISKIGKILSVNHELWDMVVPCVFMILEYKDIKTNYLFVLTHLALSENDNEKIKLVFTKNIEEIFQEMEKDELLQCHVQSEFYEKEVLINYIEAKNLNTQLKKQGVARNKKVKL